MIYENDKKPLVFDVTIYHFYRDKPAKKTGTPLFFSVWVYRHDPADSTGKHHYTTTQRGKVCAAPNDKASWLGKHIDTILPDITAKGYKHDTV